MELTDEQCFARVLEAFAGRRFPTDGLASKMLYIMFRIPCCDATVTARGFEVHFGGVYGASRYVSIAAPAVVSWLLAAVEARGEREICASLGPAEIPEIGGFMAWRMPACHVWLSSRAEVVSIRVREAVGTLDAPLPVPPWPEPQYVELRQPCPHCGQVPQRYRVLGDRSLVCLACGRSQPPRAQVVA